LRSRTDASPPDPRAPDAARRTGATGDPPPAAAPGTAPPGFPARLALYVATVAVYADMYITQPVLPVLSRELGIGPARAGTSVSAVVLAIALASPVYGPLGDALGRKRVMVWSLSLLSLPTLLCAVAPGFGALLALRALQGLFIPGVTAVSIAWAGDHFAPRDTPAVVGGIIGASVVGGLVGRVATGLVADLAGWRAAFVLFGAVTAASALGLSVALPARPRAQHAPHLAGAWRGMLRHLREPRLAGAYLVAATLFFGFVGTFTYLPYRLSAPPFRLSTTLVSSVYLVYAAGALISPVAGRLSSRLGPRTLICGGIAVAAGGIAATLARSLPVIVAGLVVLCLGMFAAQATAPAYVNRTADEPKGGASALYLTFYYVGGTLGSVVPGLAWESRGWRGVVALCAGALGIGLVAGWLLCRERPAAARAQ
jgi:YNFM family putative membrane transporter